MPVVAANGIEIYYERRGEGRRLLYLSGSGATLARTGPMIDGYAKRFDVLAHDQRGLGRTSIPPGPYSMADYAADAAALLDTIGWESCRVVGTSFGGMVAQELAVTWPERVERMALVCTSPGGAHASYPLHTLAELAPEERIAVRTTLLDTRFTPDWLATHEEDRTFLAASLGVWRHQTTGEARRGELEQLAARSRFDCVDRLGAIACPTLVAAGRYDDIAPLANAEAIAVRVPHAELRVYEGGHVFFRQDKQAFPDIVAFLAADT